MGIMVVGSAIYSPAAFVSSWPVSNVSGQTKRVTAHALQIYIGRGAWGGNWDALGSIQMEPEAFQWAQYSACFVIETYFQFQSHVQLLTLGPGRPRHKLGHLSPIEAKNEQRDRGERVYRLKDAGEEVFL